MLVRAIADGKDTVGRQKVVVVDKEGPSEGIGLARRHLRLVENASVMLCQI